MTTPARWIRFNLVGIAGFVLQMLTLAVMARWTTPTIAVVVAVLVAVSHNFLWHEQVTWPGLPRDGRLRRWLSFHLTNGTVSIVTNVVVTTAVMKGLGAPLLAANAIAVATASVANFVVSDRFIFKHRPAL